MMKSSTLFLAVFLTVVAISCADARETIDSRIGKLSFTHDFANGYPTDDTVKRLFDEIDFQRACQAYLWSVPLVSFAQWQHANDTTLDAKFDEILYEPDYVSKLVTVHSLGGYCR